MSKNVNNGVKIFYTSQGAYEAGPNDILGRGTYGIVYRVKSVEDPTKMKAIKLFMSETVDENEGIPSTTLREVNAVKSINHPNVMSIEEIVAPPTCSLNEMFIVMELCKGTLRDKVNEMIKHYLKSDKRWLDPDRHDVLPPEYVYECKIIAWQILNAVAVCHSRGIMHRDLKPANILWSENNLFKIADFGLARFVRGKALYDEHIVPQTGEVQTMWYRAPEVLLGDEKYGLLVDDWSVGCIIAEMFRFRISVTNKRMEPDPLFAGRGDVQTFLLIYESLGKCNDLYIRTLPFWSDFFPNWTKLNLRTKLRLMDDDGYNLVTKLLTLSPKNRKASRYLLCHPWFDDIKPSLKCYIPWYKGSEKEFLRLLEIDRLPPAQPLVYKFDNKENRHKN